MLPGKASPVVFGGKIHTPRDVPARVYPEPLREALLILDYVFHLLEGGGGLREPRGLDECHYARLYEVTPLRGGASEYWLALKDALEPNRRNLNVLYRAEAQVDEAAKRAAARLREPVGWGVHTRLRDEVADLCRTRDRIFRRVRLDALTVNGGERELTFGRRLTGLDRVRKTWHRGLAWIGRQAGQYSFLVFFGAAWLIAQGVSTALNLAFLRWFRFQTWFFDHQVVTLPVVLVFQLGVMLYLMVRTIPTFIDDQYKHANRADNLGSLRRLPTAAPA